MLVLTASVRDAVGSKVKIEFMRAVQVEVKTERYEPRILVRFDDGNFSAIFC